MDNKHASPANFAFIMAILRHTKKGLVNIEGVLNDPSMPASVKTKRQVYDKLYLLMKKEGIKMGGVFVGMRGDERPKQTEGEGGTRRRMGRRGAVSEGSRKGGEGDGGKKIGGSDKDDEEKAGEEEGKGEGLDQTVAQMPEGRADRNLDAGGELEVETIVKKEKVDDWLNEEW